MSRKNKMTKPVIGTKEEMLFIGEDVFGIMNRKEFKKFLCTLNHIIPGSIPEVKSYLREHLYKKHKRSSVEYHLMCMDSNKLIAHEFIGILRIIQKEYSNQKGGLRNFTYRSI